jgi:hypothetical protein
VGRVVFGLNAAICEAINARTCLRVKYRNELVTRVVEPYMFGIGSRGDAQLLCWQRSGPSASGSISGWKRLSGCDISHVDVISEVFVPRSDFATDDPLFSTVWARVV